MTTVTIPGPSSGAAGEGRVAAAAGTARPRVAIIHHVPTPYWLHLHRRIDAEIPEVELYNLYTHDVPDQPWAEDSVSDIRPQRFGLGERAETKTIFTSARRELARGGRIIRWLREQGVGVVALCGYNDAGRLRILRWCRRAGIPCLLCSDSNDKMDNARGLKRVLKRVLVGAAVRQAWGAMSFGTAGMRYFQKYGMPAERIFRLPGEPDYGLIERVTEGEIAGVRARFGLKPERRRIVYCGRVLHYKGVDTLIAGFARIADDRPGWDLVIIGDGQLREELEPALSAELKARVVWTGFLGDPATIAAVYKASDVLALPSRSEQWGLVVNEACAAGLALVISNIAGAAEDLVKPGVNGRTFSAGDSGALAAALLDVTDPANLERYRAASPGILARWRQECDPVTGMRAALRAVGVLPLTR